MVGATHPRAARSTPGDIFGNYAEDIPGISTLHDVSEATDSFLGGLWPRSSEDEDTSTTVPRASPGPPSYAWDIPISDTTYGPSPSSDIPGFTQTTSDNPSFSVDLPYGNDFGRFAVDTGGSRTDYPSNFYMESVGPHGAFDPAGLVAEACTGGTTAGWDTTDDSRYGNRISMSTDRCIGSPVNAVDNDGDGTRSAIVSLNGATVESEDPVAAADGVIEHFDFDSVPGLDYDIESRRPTTHSRTAEFLSKLPGAGDQLARWADSNYTPPPTLSSSVVSTAAEREQARQQEREEREARESEAWKHRVYADPYAADKAAAEQYEAERWANRGLPASGAATVAPGDTLGAIARKYGVSISSLQKANGIEDVNMISAGASLTIPARPTGPRPPAEAPAAPVSAPRAPVDYSAGSPDRVAYDDKVAASWATRGKPVQEPAPRVTRPVGPMMKY